MLRLTDDFDEFVQKVIDPSSKTRVRNLPHAIVLHYMHRGQMLGKSVSLKGEVGVERYINDWSFPV